MDRGPLNYDTWGIIKRRICVENVPGVELLGLNKYSLCIVSSARVC